MLASLSYCIAVASLVEHRLYHTGFRSCGAQASLAPRLLEASWSRDPGIKLVSPALAGGFLLIVPLGKSGNYFKF